MELSALARLALLSTVLSVAAAPSFAQDKGKTDGSASPAPQQQQPIGAGVEGPGPMSANPPAPPQPDWVKICKTDPKVKKEVCLTSRDLRTETGQTVASIALRAVAGDNKKFILAAVPPGLLLQPGVRVAVDQNAPANGKFSICFPNACYAELEVTDAFFKAMQKGQNLIVQAMNQEAKTLNFPVSLAGFAKANEGPSLDPKDVEEYRKEMSDAMDKQAQARRDKMQVQGAAAPTDGGPGAPGGKVQIKGQ